jgi:hypothetical protein
LPGRAPPPHARARARPSQTRFSQTLRQRRRRATAGPRPHPPHAPTPLLPWPLPAPPPRRRRAPPRARAARPEGQLPRLRAALACDGGRRRARRLGAPGAAARGQMLVNAGRMGPSKVRRRGLGRLTRAAIALAGCTRALARPGRGRAAGPSGAAAAGPRTLGAPRADLTRNLWARPPPCSAFIAARGAAGPPQPAASPPLLPHPAACTAPRRQAAPPAPAPAPNMTRCVALAALALALCVAGAAAQAPCKLYKTFTPAVGSSTIVVPDAFTVASTRVVGGPAAGQLSRAGGAPLALPLGQAAFAGTASAGTWTLRAAKLAGAGEGEALWGPLPRPAPPRPAVPPPGLTPAPLYPASARSNTQPISTWALVLCPGASAPAVGAQSGPPAADVRIGVSGHRGRGAGGAGRQRPRADPRPRRVLGAPAPSPSCRPPAPLSPRTSPLRPRCSPPAAPSPARPRPRPRPRPPTPTA